MTEPISSDVGEIPVRKISVTFERKKDLGNYENVVARAWIEGNVSTDANESEVATELANLFMSAAAAVFDQLDIEYLVDDKMIIREAHVRPISTAQAATAVKRNLGGDQVPYGGGGDAKPVRVMNAKSIEDRGEDATPPGWLVSECAKLGITGVWDKRFERDPDKNQPWYTEAVPADRKGQGHGKNGQPKGFWPPK
jgi:hypothetical protein